LSERLCYSGHDVSGEFHISTPSDHALQRSVSTRRRPSLRLLQSARPVGRVAELGSL